MRKLILLILLLWANLALAQQRPFRTVQSSQDPTGPLGLLTNLGGGQEIDLINAPTTAADSFRFYQTITNNARQLLFDLSPTAASFAVPITLQGVTGSTQCLQADTTGIISGTGSPCGGSGSTPGNPTATAGPTAINGVAATFMRSDGAPAIQLGTAAQKGLVQVDGTTITAAAGVISSTGTSTIASGTSALGTGAISSATCATAVTTAATNTATTDVVTASFNGDPTAVTGYIPLTTGMLTIIAYPTANNVNFKVCNNTSASITPGAITLNWRVVR